MRDAARFNRNSRRRSCNRRAKANPETAAVVLAHPTKDILMKKTVITAIALAVLAGCAELPESLKHPFAAAGASSTTDTPDLPAANPYPYNAPYGN
jgi:Prokaryotic membrane lipoprotein lipid attachment site